MIFEITPNAKDKHYGSLLNEQIACMPSDCWVCVRDRDTMYLSHNAGNIMLEAIEDNPEVSLFTCSTNRVWGKPLDANPNILDHMKIANERAKNKHYSYISGVIPAFWWMFPRKVWEAHPFDDHPILWPPKNPNSFDTRWTKTLPGRKMRIEHLYIWHSYRLDKNRHDFTHLKN